MTRSEAWWVITCLCVACGDGSGGTGGHAGSTGAPNDELADAPGQGPSRPEAAVPTSAYESNAALPPTHVSTLPPHEVLQVASSVLSDVPVRPLISASRDACTSPCSVYFDAIAAHSWDEVEGSRFIWAFSDGGVVDGFMSARVFELPEGEPEMTIETTLLVERDGLWVARDTHLLTVSAFAGRTICVAEDDFSGCPSGDPSDHFTSVRAAWATIETGSRILFRRGDSFPPFPFYSAVEGPVRVGAFGELGQERPRIEHVGVPWRLPSDWSVSDLEISGGGMSRAVLSIKGSNVTVIRSHFRDAGAAFSSDGDGYDFGTHKFFFHNTMTNMTGTTYVAGDTVALVGNHMERLARERHHTVRLAGVERALVANNALISSAGHTSLTVRGAKERRPGSEHVLVQANLLMQTATVQPQNVRSNEQLRRIVWERNIHVPHGTQPSIQDGLRVNGQDIVIRNNIFYQVRRAVSLQTHPLAGPSRNVRIYQNTHFLEDEQDESRSFCASGEGAADVTVDNNLVALQGDTQNTEFVLGDGVASENNYVYTPGRSALCERPDGTHPCTDPTFANTTDRNDPGFMMPRFDSPAVDKALDVPPSSDFHGMPRPLGDAPDVGAVENTERADGR